MSTHPITNLSTYKFAPLTNLKPLRERLLTVGRMGGLKGTILLSTEGINMFLAGSRAAIDAVLAELAQIPGLDQLPLKFSDSREQPFRRLLVKIKAEIIAFGVPGIDPARETAPRVRPAELKQWLDAGKPVVMLDTRNDYEIKLGTFTGAVPIGIQHFRDFPRAVQRLPEEVRNAPVVTFCTGGIRCEKAAAYLMHSGFREVYQLDGGILRYFEECGSAHYEGECFVFDQRVGVDPSLHETDHAQCFVCQTPLLPADLEDQRYVEGASCPYCFRTSAEHMVQQIATRQAAIARCTEPLPGSQPAINYRPVKIPGAAEGLPLLQFLLQTFPHLPREHWEQRFAERRIVNLDKHPVEPTQIVVSGERYFQVTEAACEPPVNPAIKILYEDEAIIVLHKPAPLPVHACGRFERNTLQSILNVVYHPQSPRPAHRLDAHTSGILVCARTRHFAGQLQPQFQRGTVRKFYLARVLGTPSADQFVSTAAISHDTGESGSRWIDEEAGLPSRTEFQVLKRFDDQTTLLLVEPKTGRTNQIRVHLWQLGWPIVGDQIYRPGQQIGTEPAASDGPVMHLHAWQLEFTHPLTRKAVRFSTDPPSWIDDAVLPL